MDYVIAAVWFAGAFVFGQTAVINARTGVSVSFDIVCVVAYALVGSVYLFRR